jgi:hypothetical protein
MEVPDDVRVEELVEAMVEAMGLPANGANGRPNRYQLNLRHDGRLTRLDENQTLVQNDVQQDASLHLTVEIITNKVVLSRSIRLEVADPWEAKATVWVIPVDVTVGELTSCVVEALQQPAAAVAGNISRYHLNRRERNGRLVPLDTHADIASLEDAGLVSNGSVLQLTIDTLAHPHHLQVKVVQASRTMRWVIPADLEAGELAAWIVDQFKLPLVKYRGQTTRYELNLQEPNGRFRRLDENKSIAANGVHSNDTLQLTTADRPVTAESQLRIFLCHSSRNKEQVRTLYRRLKTEGFKPWLDEENLLPGQDWEREIRREVSACHVVVVCLSKMSMEQGYVHREIRLALDEADKKPDGTIFVIPVRLEEVEVPDRLKQWQWADLFKEDGYSRLISALRERAVRLQDNSER